MTYSCSTHKRLSFLPKYLGRILWFVFSILYVLHLYVITVNSVDIPFQDEWKYLEPWHVMHFPDTLSLKWVLTRNNEHHILFTHLMSWLNLKLFSMNFTIQKQINYLLFGFLLAIICRLKNRIVGSKTFSYFPVFMIFTLSPIIAENHIWAFQSPFHFVLIFFTLQTLQVSSHDPGYKPSVVILILANMTMYSLAAGVALSFVCILFRCIYLLYHNKQNPSGVSNRWHVILLLGSMGLSLALWFSGYQKPEAALNRTWPHEFAFWDYFLNLLSFGFGFHNMNMLIGFFILVFTLLPVALLLAGKNTRFRPEILSIAAATTGLVAVIAMISCGRASIGEPKTSRYAEFSLLLVPLVSLAWWLVLEKTRWRTHIMLSYLCICCVGFYMSWEQWSADIYRVPFQVDMATRDCVERYYNGTGDGKCQGFWMAPADLDFAKKLQINFTKHR